MDIMKRVVMLAAFAFIGGSIILSPDFLDKALLFSSALWQGISESIRDYQKFFSREITESLRAIADEGLGSLAGWNMVLVSFLYGVFHAVGPGHGKAVVSSYSLTHEVLVRKTIAIAMASSLVQGLSAIFLVGFAWLVLDGGARSFGLDAEKILEPMSYGGFILIGLWMALHGLRAKESNCRCDGHVCLVYGDNHSHAAPCHDHAMADDDPQSLQGDVQRQVAVSAFEKGARILSRFSLKETYVMTLAIGIRPCSGALLVLVLAFLMGQWTAGLASVIAMSIGAGLTVSAVALSAKGIRVPILQFIESLGGNQFWLGRLIPVLGGGVIGALGAFLMYDYITRPVHPFM